MKNINYLYNPFSGGLIRVLCRTSVGEPMSPMMRLALSDAWICKPTVSDDVTLFTINCEGYFNSSFNCNKMNYNIRKSYDDASGVVFQTIFKMSKHFSNIFKNFLKILKYL